MISENPVDQDCIHQPKEFNSMSIPYQSYHDLKNCLFVVMGYMELGEYEKAKCKLNYICKKLNVRNTTNPILRSFIYNKIHSCPSNNINFKALNLDIPETYIEECDLFSVIGNALDNAVESCDKVPDKSKRYISMSMFIKNKYLNIVITNPISEKVKIENNNILTTKNEKHIHGFGLNNIRIMAKKYHGHVSISRGLRKFAIKIKLRVD